ncbi:MAG: ribonuclease P protein component [Thermoflexales bacterium]|nr:ribonuclease P protein component [Thermoflexales bacterium]
MARLVALRAAADFQRVRATGQTWRGRGMTLNAAPWPGDGTSFRIGLIASRRVGGAVERNRARRILREALRHLAPDVAPDWDLVFVAHPALLSSKAAYRDARDEIVWLLSKARALRKT